MNVKILLAALAAGVATFLLGWVVYGMMLDPYFRTMLTPEGQAAVKAVSYTHLLMSTLNAISKLMTAPAMAPVLNVEMLAQRL